MSPEQCLNLDRLANKGFAIRIPRRALTPEALCQAIDRLLADPQAQTRAREYQRVAAEWDNPRHIRAFFCETFGRED